jgi:hypothetical protein
MAAKFQDKLEEQLTCALCFEVYNEDSKAPKGLPCLHNFCLECLERYIQKNIGSELRCPLCQVTFNVPDDGVQAIPTNVVVKGMLELLVHEVPQAEKEEKGVPTTIWCTEHMERECEIVCMTCKVGMCNTCMKKSVRKGSHANHEVKEVDEAIRAIDGMLRASRREHDFFTTYIFTTRHFTMW